MNSGEENGLLAAICKEGKNMKHRPQRLHSLLLSLGSEILGKIKDPAVNNGLGNEIISFTDVKVSKDLTRQP